MANKVYPIKTKYVVEDGTHCIHLVISEEEDNPIIKILTDDEQKNFIFEDELTPETLKRWRAILKLMELAIKHAENTT